MVTIEKFIYKTGVFTIMNLENKINQDAGTRQDTPSLGRKISHYVLVGFMALQAACNAIAGPTQAPLPTKEPTKAATGTFTPEPTITPTETPTLTPTVTPIYLEGILFFDMNGSGLRDESSFIYEKDFFNTDEINGPLFQGRPELLEAVLALGELEDGQLVTMYEPALHEGLEVCVADDCVTPNDDGSFSILVPDKEIGQNALVNIHDLNASVPELALRYFNKFIDFVDIPAYEMNGVQVPEQNLTDTEVIPIDKGSKVNLLDDDILDMALMQGYLTLPFDVFTEYFLWSYVDLDYQLGQVRNYLNESLWPVNPYIHINSPNARSGTHDNHQGIDYNMENGTFLLAMANGNMVQVRDQFHYVRIQHSIRQDHYVTGYEHNTTNLVREGDKVLRGQIIALSGDWDDGIYGGSQPHVHIHHWKIPLEWAHNPIWYIFEDNLRQKIPFSGVYVQIVDDPYRDVLTEDSINYWTVDNNPHSPH